jgi:4-amino-4-deoxy-L-arabinose transferase-like glycosyltransferase
MKKVPQPLTDLIISLIGALLLGAALAAFCPGSFWQSWLASGLLLLVSLFLLIRLWRKFTATKTLAVLILVTFLLRLAVGVVVYKVLPVSGYDTPVQNAGFLYADAFARDQAAFKLASSQDSLFQAFTKPDISDQYGGLLFMSTAIYRFLSPEAARPLLITLLAAFAMAAGAAFLWSAIQKRWTARIAVLACWIYAIFPDSVLLGSSQMREPFLIALACIGFWAMLQWQKMTWKALLIAAISTAAACLFSLPAGFIIAAILAAIFVMDWSLAQSNQKIKNIGFAVLAVLGIGAILAGWMWLKKTLYYDAYTTKIGSGWITDLISKYGEQWNIPFVTIYGLTQPLLPAAIFEPSLPFWVTVAILRAVGWYLALPLLIYGAFASWKAENKEHKWILVMLSIVFLIWVVVSSGRAGGDQWDNPRYRYILLPFMALIIAWAVENYKKTHSPWLWRWVAVIAVFLLFFMNFYANRYILGIGTQLPFLLMIGLIVVVSFLILGGSWLRDKLRARGK